MITVKSDNVIQITSKRFGFFPQSFTWRDKTYEVCVERCWTISHRWLWEVEQYYFRVRCAEGTFEIYQDQKTCTWHIASFNPAATPATAD